MQRHALIVGSRGVGKSTLISQVLSQLKSPVTGFETVKLPIQSGAHPIHILEVGRQDFPTEENLVGRCREKCLEVFPQVFDRFAPRLLAPKPHGALVKLDELGILESSSPVFCAGVMTLLDGEVPVIAAVKHKHTPFLDGVRSHGNCRVFHLTEENRQVIQAQVLAFFKSQLEK